MPHTDAFITKTKKLTRRDWDGLLEMWVSYPRAANTPGKAPESDVSDLPSIRDILDSTTGQHPKNILEDPAGLRAGVLKEALFNLQKATYTLRASRVERGAGLRVWCLSTAYQSAYFAMRSLIGFFGVTILSRQKRKTTHIVDVFSERIEGSRMESGSHRRSIRIIDAQRSVDHKELWAILRQLLINAKAQPDVLDREYISVLVEIPETDYGRQRHEIHYRPHKWPFDELWHSTINDGFGDFSNHDQIVKCLADPDAPEFLIALAVALLSMGVRVLASLCSASQAFKKELFVVEVWLLEEASIRG